MNFDENQNIVEIFFTFTFNLCCQSDFLMANRFIHDLPKPFKIPFSYLCTYFGMALIQNPL